jgi:hypothetical protein
MDRIGQSDTAHGAVHGRADENVSRDGNDGGFRAVLEENEVSR